MLRIQVKLGEDSSTEVTQVVNMQQLNLLGEVHNDN